jgi:RES domain-containing protein
MLERLVQHRNLGGTLVVEAEVSEGIGIDDLMAALPPGRRLIGSPAAAAAGGAWLAARRTTLLRVPSAVVPREANYLVNPAHPDATRIRVGAPEPLE